MDNNLESTIIEGSTVNNMSDENNQQRTKKHSASNSRDMAPQPVLTMAKKDGALVLDSNSPANLLNNFQPARRGEHMAKKKAAKDAKDTTAADKKKKKERRTRFNSKSNDKHAPYFGSGVQFQWSDNGHVSKFKAKLNSPDASLLKIKLTDTNGKVWRSAKFVKHAVMDWTDKRMVKDLNKWRSQFLSRTLDKNSDTPKSTRPRWSSGEMHYMAMLIKEAIKEKQGRLAKSDWIGIAERMNNRFKGTTARKGEQVPDTLNAKKILIKGNVLKKDHIIPERSFNTMKNQASRWPEVVRMMAQELDAISSSSTEDDAESSTKGKYSNSSTGAQRTINNVGNIGSFGNLSLDSDSEHEESTQEDSESEEMGIVEGLGDVSEDEIGDESPVSDSTVAMPMAA